MAPAARSNSKTPLHLRETVITGTEARLQALLAAKTTLKLGADTRVRIDQFIVDKGRRIVVFERRASVAGAVEELSQGLHHR